ncbi:hypothetical protein [Methylobacterium nodulans]|uniref:Uncharacterized protein n=1 Tax=Methylobacterium nodulans (strain LMG 21967 / CNCM I-2342 / ORS 2060) TaxID=460265 RepID=B8IRL3_METNO|nr:hypothetical protein [Methylobacterium nodulans]ACL60563.1 hypothetical protein Mnod_5734 [Methylobacterium nodulans ORS 2060]
MRSHVHIHADDPACPTCPQVQARALMGRAEPHAGADDACPHVQRWRNMLGAVDAVRDRLGRPVDAGIRDTVVALNLLGLPTLQSCEGHVNAAGHGLAAPWIDLAVEGPVLVRAATLLKAFYADVAPPEADLRLMLEGERLGNGGGFAVLETARLALAEGRCTPTEVERLRERLALRQAEMQRFTSFLRRRLVEETTSRVADVCGTNTQSRG